MSTTANAPSAQRASAAVESLQPLMFRGVLGARLSYLLVCMLSLCWSLAHAVDFADVWLRRIVVDPNVRSFVDLLPLENGDIALINGERGIGFFSGQTLTRGQAQQHALDTSNIRPYQIVLTDGRMVRRVGPPGCVSRPDVTVALEDAQHRIQKQYALIWIPETPRRLNAAECALVGAPPSTLQHALILDPKLFALPDNTFLAADAQSGVVIRFDGDFSSNSSLLGDRLLLMPADQFKSLIKANVDTSIPSHFNWLAFQAALEQWVDAHRKSGSHP